MQRCFCVLWQNELRFVAKRRAFRYKTGGVLWQNGSRFDTKRKLRVIILTEKCRTFIFYSYLCSTNKTNLSENMKLLKTMALALFACTTAWGQPHYDYTKLKTEKLNRGLVAIKQDDGKVALSWRTLKSDRKGEPFNVFRNGNRLNKEPLTDGGTFFIDDIGTVRGDVRYVVTGGGIDGEYVLSPDAQPGYVAIPLQKPEGGTTPDGRNYRYSANDASVADVDGDGQYEILLKWDPSNSHDNAHDGFTGPTLFDCYRMDGTLLWRIDMGPNIRSGAHYVPFIFYDLDGDGCAEFIVKTADGTCSNGNTYIGDPTANYRVMERPNQGRILTGPEYITVFDGKSGRPLDTKPYIPERGELKGWGDERGNRSERYLAAVGYLDGTHASAIFCRGYYTRTVIAAWDWDGKELREHWTFDTNQPQWRSYAGQGNHNLRVADVDGDGCDEITYGSMAVDHDGRGLYNTGMGHGDAIHLMAFDPTTDRLQVWDCHENKRDGSDFRDAATGQVIFQARAT